MNKTYKEIVEFIEKYGINSELEKIKVKVKNDKK